jgi:uncharacterized protein
MTPRRRHRNFLGEPAKASPAVATSPPRITVPLALALLLAAGGPLGAGEPANGRRAAEVPVPELSTPEEPVTKESAAAEPLATQTDLLALSDGYSSGAAGRLDEERARELLLQAVDAGDPRATMRLATVHALGSLGFPRDPAAAARLAASVRSEVHALAVDGDAIAQYLVGVELAHGIGVAADPAAAIGWYRRAAEQGHPWALHNLAWMQSVGLGMPADPVAALEGYRRAAEAGNVRSMLEVGRAALSGIGVLVEAEEAGKWLRRAAEAGNVTAMGLLGSQLLEGPRLPADPAEAHRWLAPAAAAGDAQALYALGYAYLFGLGVEMDRTRAEVLFDQGSERGSGDARLWSGWLRRMPDGAERGTSSAVELMAARVAAGDEWAMPVLLEWMAQGSTSTAHRDAAVARLEKAAQKGRAPALALLADLALHGLTGHAADPVRAVELARRAAEAGSAAAMSTLGHAYYRGAGVPKERDRAYEWWERAAGAGHRNAQLVLGRAYLDGREVTRDAERGIALLEQAAEAGELRAMRDLADLFDTGWAVVAPDLERAHRWYERLAANGDEMARGWLRYQELVGSR